MIFNFKKYPIMDKERMTAIEKAVSEIKYFNSDTKDALIATGFLTHNAHLPVSAVTRPLRNKLEIAYLKSLTSCHVPFSMGSDGAKMLMNNEFFAQNVYNVYVGNISTVVPSPVHLMFGGVDTQSLVRKVAGQIMSSGKLQDIDADKLVYNQSFFIPVRSKRNYHRMNIDVSYSTPKHPSPAGQPFLHVTIKNDKRDKFQFSESYVDNGLAGNLSVYHIKVGVESDHGFVQEDFTSRKWRNYQAGFTSHLLRIEEILDAKR